MDLEEASDRLYGIWFQLNRFYEAQGSDGLPLSQRYALFLLARGPLTQREIRAMTMWPKQTAHSVVQALVQKGWAELVPREDDRRAKDVRLTDKGATEAERVSAPIREAERRALGALDEGELARMLDNLQAYADALSAQE